MQAAALSGVPMFRNASYVILQVTVVSQADFSLIAPLQQIRNVTWSCITLPTVP